MPDLRPGYIAPGDEHLYPASGSAVFDYVPEVLTEEERRKREAPKDPNRSVDPMDVNFLKGCEERYRVRWDLPACEFTPPKTIGEWQERMAALDKEPECPESTKTAARK